MFRYHAPVPGTTIKTGVGVIVRDEQGRILLERRSDCGMWGLLGGAIDPGESASATAVREVREESGFDIEIVSFVGVYTEPIDRFIVYPDNDDVRQLVDIVMEGRIVGGALAVSDESEAVEFFSPDKLPDESEIIPPVRQPLADFRAGLRGVLK